VFRVIQIRQHSRGRGTQNSLLERISLDYPLLGPEIDDRKDYQKPGEP
jgi:hypothetical protein